jgi:HTH-type transcriptional regulator/antitoxin HigA
MILNERTFRLVRARAAHLQREIADSTFRDLKSQLSTEIIVARRTALLQELDRLNLQIQGYERLKGPNREETQNLDAEELGLLPILGRIARGLSQRQLAELLELKEQQVQRYESEKYSGISLARYEKVLRALGIQLSPEWRQSPLEDVEQKSLESLFLDLPAEIVREVQNRTWLVQSIDANSKVSAHSLSKYVVEAGKLVQGAALHRRTVSAKKNNSSASLLLWQARAINIAQSRVSRLRNKFNLAEMKWISQLVRLSTRDDGPRRATDFLEEQGIIVAVEAALPGTSLDGAAMLLADSTPLIALTLRYDRLDSFWFTLLHEIGHIFLHFNGGLSEGFFDDLDEADNSRRENEANSFARSALISDEAWSTSPARFSKSIEPVKAFAANQSVGIAVAVGRLRRERQNYTLFSQYLGQGTVRRQLSPMQE